MKIIGEKEIKTLDDYQIYGAPECGDNQWKDDYSAKEFARIVLSDSFCSDMQSMIGGLKIEIAYPEKKVNFDKFGRARQHDLACVATVNGEPAVLCFEAKANEPFSDKVIEKLDEAKKKLKNNENTNIPARIKGLCKRLWNSDITGEIKNLYYQLLHATAGTLSFAEKVNAPTAYFVIYQIETNVTDEEKCNEHFEAVQDFVRMFGKEIEKDIVCNIGKIDGIDLNILFVQRKKSESV